MNKKKSFTYNQMAHLSVNYAINCLKGYNGSFEDWFKGLSSDWIKIANRKVK